MKDVETSKLGIVKYSDVTKRRPGSVRDAIIETLSYRTGGATVAEITREVSERIGPTPASSVRSYLRLNSPKLFTKRDRGHYRIREEAQATLPFRNSLAAAVVSRNTRGLSGATRPTTPKPTREAFRFGDATLIHGDCFEWLATAQTNSIEAVVTDPPYGLVEYSELEQDKLRKGD